MDSKSEALLGDRKEVYSVYKSGKDATIMALYSTKEECLNGDISEVMDYVTGPSNNYPDHLSNTYREKPDEDEPVLDQIEGLLIDAEMALDIFSEILGDAWELLNKYTDINDNTSEDGGIDGEDY